jgi:hypothetical protein
VEAWAFPDPLVMVGAVVAVDVDALVEACAWVPVAVVPEELDVVVEEVDDVEMSPVVTRATALSDAVLPS